MVITRTIDLLRNHRIVIELRISKTLIGHEIEMIKANSTLIDESILFVNEAVGENWREYSYHWQKGGKMIRRWDNAPHHKDLPNFPHHMHNENDILSSENMNLTEVLTYIEAELKKSNNDKS